MMAAKVPCLAKRIKKAHNTGLCRSCDLLCMMSKVMTSQSYFLSSSHSSAFSPAKR